VQRDLRRPASVAVIHDDRQNRWQPAIGRQALFLHEVLPQQAGIDQRAERHPVVGGGLELQQQHQVGVAAATPRNAPDHDAVASLGRLGVEFCVHALHAVQIKVVEPGSGDELAQQLGHHAGMAEQAMMERIVVGHACCLPRLRPRR
jgi:hypothetical protein